HTSCLSDWSSDVCSSDLAVGGRLCDLIAKCVDQKVSVKSQFDQSADLVVFGNQVVYYQAHVDKLAVAIAQEAPFKLSIVQPKVRSEERRVGKECSERWAE